MRAASVITLLLLIGSSVSLTSARGDEFAAPNPNLPDLQEVPAPIPDPPALQRTKAPAPQPVPTHVLPASATQPARSVREARIYRLSNSEAGKVAEAIDLFLQVKYHVFAPREDGDAAPWKIVAEATTNSIIASAEPPIQGEIERLIRELDAPRTQIEVQVKISVTGLDGKPDIHSEPRIITLNGQRAVVGIESADGTRLHVELTPRVVERTEDK